MKFYMLKTNCLAFITLTLMLLTLVLGLSGGSPVQAATLTVDGTCTDSDGDGVCDDGVTYKTIQAAVNAAAVGDTIQVLPATYPERVLIDKPLVVNGDPGDLATVGPGSNAPVVDGGGAAGYGFRIAAGVDNVSISGFIIQNFGAGPESAGGQSVGVGAVNPTLDPTTAITVSHNRFEDINWAAVFFLNGGQSTYQNIVIQYNVVNVGPWALNSNVYGIECTNCANATIANNLVSGGANGIVLSAQGTAAYPVMAANNAILNNEVRNADEGNILLMSYDPAWATGAPLLQGTRIEGNRLTNDGALGSQGNSAILVYSYENGTLDGLSVLNNTIAVTNSDNIPLDLATTANITLDGNAITVANPAVAGRVLYMNTVGGSHINVLNNQIAINGATAAEHFHALDLNGGEASGARSRSGVGVWSTQHPFPLSAQRQPQAVTGRPGFEGARISGNTFTSNHVGAYSAGVRLRETLPATATVSVLNNTISGFYSGIWPNAPLNFFVRDNQLLQNDYGLLTSGSGAKLNLIATGNVISGNSVAGIALAASSPLSATLGGSLPAANTFRNNGPGGALNLRVELPVTNPIVEATFNDWGLTDVCAIAATFDERSGVRLIHYYDMQATAAPTTIPADNVTPSSITGALTGLYAPAGNVVSFTTNLGTLTPATALADAAGEAHSALRSDTEGTALVVATAGMACAYTEYDQVTVVVSASGPGPHLIYLPIVVRSYTPLPDLVVTALEATRYGITVTIENQGTASVDDAFWVDVYINPDTAPRVVNEIWMYVGDYGLAWGIPTNLTPMQPGDVLTLTVGDAYYYPEYSNVTWPLATGAVIYAQVDSNNPATAYGAILENHEAYGWSYNNVFGPVQSFVLQSRGTPPATSRPHLHSGALPPRPSYP